MAKQNPEETFDVIRNPISKPTKGLVDSLIERQNASKGIQYPNIPQPGGGTRGRKPRRGSRPRNVSPQTPFTQFKPSGPWIEKREESPLIYENKIKNRFKEPEPVQQVQPQEEYTETGYGVDYGMGTENPYTQEVVDSKGNKKVIFSDTQVGLKSKVLKFQEKNRKDIAKINKEKDESVSDKELKKARKEMLMNTRGWNLDMVEQYEKWEEKSAEQLMGINEKWENKYFAEDDEDNVYSEGTKQYFRKKQIILQELIDRKLEEGSTKFRFVGDAKLLPKDNIVDEELKSTYSFENLPPYLVEQPVLYGENHIMYNGGLYTKEAFSRKVLQLSREYKSPSTIFEENIKRPFARVNEDGTESRVLMVSEEFDGKYYAFPTLFPSDPNDETAGWIQFDYNTELEQAFEYALDVNEAIEFDTQEEADAFARGSWKKD